MLDIAVYQYHAANFVFVSLESVKKAITQLSDTQIAVMETYTYNYVFLVKSVKFLPFCQIYYHISRVDGKRNFLIN